MNTYILIMTLIIFQASGNVGEIEVAEFDNQVSCLEAGIKWSEKIQNDASSSVDTIIVCAKK